MTARRTKTGPRKLTALLFALAVLASACETVTARSESGAPRRSSPDDPLGMHFLVVDVGGVTGIHDPRLLLNDTVTTKGPDGKENEGFVSGPVKLVDWRTGADCPIGSIQEATDKCTSERGAFLSRRPSLEDEHLPGYAWPAEGNGHDATLYHALPDFRGLDRFKYRPCNGATCSKDVATASLLVGDLQLDAQPDPGSVELFARGRRLASCWEPRCFAWGGEAAGAFVVDKSGRWETAARTLFANDVLTIDGWLAPQTWSEVTSFKLDPRSTLGAQVTYIPSPSGLLSFGDVRYQGPERTAPAPATTDSFAYTLCTKWYPYGESGHSSGCARARVTVTLPELKGPTTTTTTSTTTVPSSGFWGGDPTTTTTTAVVADADGDGIGNSTDNCVNVTNPTQVNTDGDAQGDACDPDDDNDTVLDGGDNCALVANVGQLDTDGDGLGNACDTDDDGDGFLDGDDNCPLDNNPFQDDSNGNNIGDECDFVTFTIELDGTFATPNRSYQQAPLDKVTIRLVNNDDTNHTFSLDRNGNGNFNDDFGYFQSVAVGDTEQFELTNLPPGTYDIRCNIGGHNDLVGTLTITA